LSGFEKSPYEPEAVEVVSREGVPVAVTIKKRRLPVREVLNTWRIDEEWWRAPISRLYFLLQFDNGIRATVFHDLEGNRWYRQLSGLASPPPRTKSAEPPLHKEDDP
jgi:hypothetical protein